ncbi:hypothetical protein PG997_002771 [Apiospora hydei]|uniref:Uncharacterized protein n=1 Tax=Apiospora hydei TaxID=1337664 RepID=A0ABR1WXD7_9PEZI
MNGERQTDRVSEKATVTHADCSSSACKHSSGSILTTQKKDSNEEILKLLQAIQRNGERQIQLLEDAITEEPDMEERQEHMNQQPIAPEKKPNLAYKPWSSYEPWMGRHDEAATDLFTSSDEDQKLSMVIILGTLRVTPTLMDKLNVGEKAWSDMDPDLAQYIIREWLKNPDLGFSPYGETHAIFPHELLRRTCKVGTGPIRMSDNLFHFQHMAFVMEFMAIQAPRGPVLSNVEAAWDFTLAFVAPWKTIVQPSCTRHNGFWTSPKDSAHRILLETLTLQHFMRVFSTIQKDSSKAD